MTPLTEIIVRRPTYLAFESMLRDSIPDNEARFRVAGELLFYTEKARHRNPEERNRFRAELEAILDKERSDRVIFNAKKIYKWNRLVLHALRAIWLILFLVGVWGIGRLFVGWGWGPYASLLAAAFVSGAILELGKWALLTLLIGNWKRPKVIL